MSDRSVLGIVADPQVHHLSRTDLLEAVLQDLPVLLGPTVKSEGESGLGVQFGQGLTDPLDAVRVLLLEAAHSPGWIPLAQQVRTEEEGLVLLVELDLDLRLGPDSDEVRLDVLRSPAPARPHLDSPMLLADGHGLLPDLGPFFLSTGQPSGVVRIARMASQSPDVEPWPRPLGRDTVPVEGLASSPDP